MIRLAQNDAKACADSGGRPVAALHRVVYVLGTALLLSSCTWKIQLVPAPVSGEVQDVPARKRLNNIVACLPDAERKCIDTEEALQQKE